MLTYHCKLITNFCFLTLCVDRFNIQHVFLPFVHVPKSAKTDLTGRCPLKINVIEKVFAASGGAFIGEAP